MLCFLVAKTELIVVPASRPLYGFMLQCWNYEEEPRWLAYCWSSMTSGRLCAHTTVGGRDTRIKEISSNSFHCQLLCKGFVSLSLHLLTEDYFCPKVLWEILLPMLLISELHWYGLIICCCVSLQISIDKSVHKCLIINNVGGTPSPIAKITRLEYSRYCTVDVVCKSCQHRAARFIVLNLKCNGDPQALKCNNRFL